MTIEERAKRAWVNAYDASAEGEVNYADGYIQGATDQQKIDIENGKKFCKKWLDEIIQIYLPNLKDEPYYTKVLEHTYKVFEKAMEK